MTSPLPPAARRYLAVITLLGAAAIGESFKDLLEHPIGYEWFLLGALTLASGSATVKLPSVPATISVSETFVVASVLLFGPAAGTLTVALDALVMSYWQARGRPQLHRVLFNVAVTSLSVSAAGHAFFAVGPAAPLSIQPSTLSDILIPLILFALFYFSLNTSLIAIIIGLETGSSPFVVWRKNLAWLALNYVCGASVASLLVLYTRTLDLQFLSVIVPLLLVLYMTFKTAMGRVEDANRHLGQLNSLYLSTIETLAMAIDAKDQITHGHIRRVQTYAVGLARALGIRDELQIKAIEAAALLHDMGKLAVPEYILNKPGRLTAAEFDKMKLHASIGADILSSIDFPYPVVPIVRHHHENWLGDGYPDGLKGPDIPIGARILSVVDCFDALTSDRPYRPRLPDSEALQILIDRRGTMYDPLIVDTFLEVYRQIAPEANALSPTSRSRVALAAISGSTDATNPPTTTSPFNSLSSSSMEVLALYELTSGLAALKSVEDVGDVLSRHLRRLVPAAICALYVYDASRDELYCASAVGEHAMALQSLRIPMGQRLTGWVAANRQIMVNSDPTLDLGDIANTGDLHLRSCLSAPLILGSRLIGVISFYSSHMTAFTDEHRRLCEVVTRPIAGAISQVIEQERASALSPADPLSTVPHLKELQRFFCTSNYIQSLAPISMILLDICAHPSQPDWPAETLDAVAIERLASSIMRNLRVTDVLFRCTHSQFIAVLPCTDPTTAATVASRLESAIGCSHDGCTTEPPIVVSATTTVATSGELLTPIDALRSLAPIGFNGSEGRAAIH